MPTYYKLREKGASSGLLYETRSQADHELRHRFGPLIRQNYEIVEITMEPAEPTSPPPPA